MRERFAIVTYEIRRKRGRGIDYGEPDYCGLGFGYLVETPGWARLVFSVD